MPFPLVWRSTYEAVVESCRRLERELEGSQAAQRVLQQAHTDLVNKLVELKRLGFEIPANYGEPARSGPALPPEIVDAMEERARRNTPLWHELGRFAESRLRENADLEELREEILAGGEVPL